MEFFEINFDFACFFLDDDDLLWDISFYVFRKFLVVRVGGSMSWLFFSFF